MRILPLFLFHLFILSFFDLSAQVKIGDNPEIIDGASVLELESNAGALVIPRLSDVSMQGLTPLRGALVYNIDQGCVFQFDGQAWKNLCENTSNSTLVFDNGELILTDTMGNAVTVALDGAVQQTFTADPVVNFAETIVITQTGTNFNFEVGIINTDNIAEGGVNGSDIQDASITAADLAPDSVNSIILSENAVDDNAIDYSEVTLSDFVNDAGFITNSEDADPDPENEIQELRYDVNTRRLTLTLAPANNFMDFNPLWNAIDGANQSIQNAIVTFRDRDPQNELTRILDQGDGTTLIRSNVGVDANGDYITQEILVNSVPSTDDQKLDQNGTFYNNGNGALTIALENGGTVTADLRALRDAESDDQVISGNFNTANNTLRIQLEDGGDVTADLSSLNQAANLGALALVVSELDDTDIEATHNAVNYSPADDNVLGHLAGIDNALNGLITSGGSDGRISDVAVNGTGLEFTGNLGAFNGNVNLEPLVDAAVANNNYLTAEVDGSITNELQSLAWNPAAGTLSLSQDGVTADLSTFYAKKSDLDDLATLVSTDGDGDATNELQGLDFDTTTGRLTLTDDITAAPDLDAYYASETEVIGIINTQYPNLDTDSTDDIQQITSNDGSITVTTNGNSIDLSIAVISGGPNGIIAANSITAGNIGSNAVGPSEIQSNAVSSDEIENESIMDEDISPTAAIRGSKILPDFGTQDVITNGDFIEKNQQVIPDYVFQKYFDGISSLNTEYHFKSLSEVEAFVKENKHLPGVTSAATSKKMGFWNLSKSNLQNLEKIEELFLHTIEQEKKIESLQSENQTLKTELETLKDEIAQIKKMITLKN